MNLKTLQFRKCAVICLIAISFLPQIHANSESDEMVLVNGGAFFPPLSNQKKKSKIKSFLLDKYPVTRRDYKKFLNENPNWKKENIKSIYADSNYLSNWKDCGIFESTCGEDSPVTNVSWFTARAYCSWKGKRLPAVMEWEFAATDGGTLTQKDYDKILEWYAKPNPKVLPKVGTVWKSKSGAYDLIGSIWEWVEDFNTTSVTEDSREDSNVDRTLFCGASSLALKDFKNYASYMRFAFRSGLRGKYTIANLGFRCARDLPVTVK